MISRGRKCICDSEWVDMHSTVVITIHLHPKTTASFDLVWILDRPLFQNECLFSFLFSGYVVCTLHTNTQLESSTHSIFLSLYFLSIWNEISWGKKFAPAAYNKCVVLIKCSIFCSQPELILAITYRHITFLLVNTHTHTQFWHRNNKLVTERSENLWNCMLLLCVKWMHGRLHVPLL